MDGTSRRGFLKRAAVTAGGAVLLSAGCSKPLDASPREGQQAPAPSGQAPPEKDGVQISIARRPGEPATPEELKQLAAKLTQTAIENLGGIGRFVKRGDVVWVKPNINFHREPQFAANTSPDVVAAVIKLCLDAGAGKVKVGDNSSFGSEKSYPMSGIEEAAKAAGAEVVYMDKDRFKEYDVGGKRVGKWPLYPDVMESNLIINLPIAKHHIGTKITCCIKNHMGIAGGKRGTWHDNLPEYTCDLAAFVKPRLTIVDAVHMLTNHGPKGGELEDVKYGGLVAAGVDLVALDALVAELLGNKPLEVPTLAEASSRALGEIDYRKLVLKDVTIA
jgi:uncharacterized protein (DUF362 family)